MAVYRKEKFTEKGYLLYLHLQLAQFKKYCIDEKMAENDDFEKYNALDISPLQMYRSKDDHEVAVFVLAMDLTNNMRNVIEHYKKIRRNVKIKY